MEMCDVTFHKLQAILGFGDIRFFIIGNSLLCFHILWVTMASAMVQSLLHHPTLLPLSLLTYRPIFVPPDFHTKGYLQESPGQRQRVHHFLFVVKNNRRR